MGQKMTKFCDRCGRDISGTVPAEIRVEVKRFNTDYHETNVDLCEPCSIQLTAWLERANGGAPPGYKFVPRPCPHRVPCGDPTGCSGVELIPLLGGGTVEVKTQ